MRRLLAALALLPLGCLPPADAPKRTATEPSRSNVNLQPPPAKAEITTTVDQMLKDYRDNAVAADQKYQGKAVQVTGKFAALQKASLYGETVQLWPEDELLSLTGIACVLHIDHRDGGAKLRPDDKVTLLGECDGIRVGLITLKRCAIVKN